MRSVRPRPERDWALGGAVTGAGLLGRRAAVARYVRAAADVPDLIVFDAGMLLDGQDGDWYWGRFGPDWGAKPGISSARPPFTDGRAPVQSRVSEGALTQTRSGP